MRNKGWIGVDLDGTLAHYDGWKGPEHIGKPIKAMLSRVLEWLVNRKDIDVKIFTARVAESDDPDSPVRLAINAWCEKHIGRVLEVTCKKDYGMIELWDDRCVQVIPNTGMPIDPNRQTFDEQQANRAADHF